MRRLVGMGLVAVAGWVGTDGPVWGAGPIPMKVTSKPHFRIPYRFDSAALQRMNAQELQLFVSRDRGASWELSQAIPPDSGKFEFEAPADGEYWFSVKTLDGRRQLQPDGRVFEPGLKVVVDTAEPRLDLSLQQPAPGRVQVAWHAHDANLDPASLLLEYRGPGAFEWQPLRVPPQRDGQSLLPVPQGGEFAVRGSVLDAAGNSGRSQQTLAVQGADGSGRRGGPDPRQPVAEGPSVVGPTMPHATRTDHAPALSASIEPVPRPEPAPASPLMTPAPTGNRYVSDSPERRPEITQKRFPLPGEGMPADPPARPGSARERVVKSPRFQVAYKVDDVGPSGVGGVEIYITQDRGKKWFKYGEDTDRQSPFDVIVPRDGEYGFDIRVRSGAGLAAEPPADGEAPAITVVVDQTPPQLELLSVQQGPGSDQNQLVVRWRAADPHPAEQSIAVHYAATKDGPWEPATDWRNDVGHFTWTIPPNGPAQVYLRVLARDAAGNVSQAETPRPVLIDLTKPTARIVDVEVTPTNYPH